MKKREDYTIHYIGLAQGEHNFSYSVDDTFFSGFENSVVKAGKVGVEVELTKQENVLLLNFSFEGWLRMACHRCLDEFDFPLVGENRLIVKLGDRAEEESDEVITIPVESNQLDLTQYIFEFIELLVPLRVVHPDNANGKSTCNPEVLKIMNRHIDNEKKHENHTWDQLKKLKFK
jgi:uncharacterized protein